jgi:hypothetical protein
VGGADVHENGGPVPREVRVHGKAEQVDPIKPTLKPPGTKRLNPKYDKLLSNLLSFCFRFQLAPLQHGDRRAGAVRRHVRELGRAVQVEPIKPTLKAPGSKRLKLEYGKLL